MFSKQFSSIALLSTLMTSHRVHAEVVTLPTFTHLGYATSRFPFLFPFHSCFAQERQSLLDVLARKFLAPSFCFQPAAHSLYN